MKTIRIFISSPGDVAEERDKARRVVEALQKRYAGRLKLETVLWENLPLGAVDSFQGGIDAVLKGENAIDIAVFILWSRLGSPLGAAIRRPDGSEYRSGTEREFDLMLTAYEQSGQTRPQILAYVRQDQDGFIEAQRGKDISALSEMIRQRELVDAFIREEFHDSDTSANLRAFHTFPHPATFAVRLRQHLRAMLDEVAAKAGVPVDQQWEDEPYLGLRAFDLQHAPIFFGREQETGSVLESLQAQQRHGCAFVLLVGSSGSGKSSLLRAGVIPDLIEGGDEEGVVWRRAVLTPGECADGLLQGLARALFARDAIPELREDDASLAELAEAFSGAPKQAAQQVRRALQRASAAPAATRLVLLADQFEEVFTHAAFSEEDIRAFAEALKTLAECGRVSILATVRSDYYGRCQQVSALMSMKAPAGQIDLVAPGQTALARIIARPAQLAGLRFEENPATGETLDQRILADIGNNPEALPLVEFALTRLWESRSPDGTLTFAQYETLGGVEGAIGHHAENVFKGLPDEVKVEFGSVFNALVTLAETDDAQPVRRRVRVESVANSPARKQLIDALTAARLLVSDQGEMFVAHEALFRRWERAVQWIESNRDFLRVRARVAARMKEGSRLLDGDPLLETARHQLAALSNGFDAEQAAFINDCVKKAQQARQKRDRLRQAVVAVLSVLLLITAWEWWQAVQSKRRADEKRREAQQTLSRSDFFQGTMLLDQGKASEGMAYLARAIRTDPKNVSAAARLYSALIYREFCLPIGKPMRHENTVDSAEFSPDGKWVVTASVDGTARVWNASTGLPISESMQHGKFVRSALFSPDGKWVVTVSGEDTVRVWDGATGRPLSAPICHKALVSSACFSPDGQWVVTASFDGTARVWDAATGKPVSAPMLHQNTVRSAEFSPDGKRVITVSSDNVRVWDAATGKPVGEPLRHEGKVNSASFSPDGKRVVTASHDKTARLWDASTGLPVSDSMRHEDGVCSAKFSPDGRRVVTASVDHTARVWDTSTGLPVSEPMRHQKTVRWAEFSPDGKQVITVSEDNIALVWDASTGRLTSEPMCHEAIVWSAKFSPDGKRVVTASGDKTARLWDASTGLPVSEPMRHEDSVLSAKFSSDGKRIVTASEDGTARVWDVAMVKLVSEPMRHESVVRSAHFSPDGKRVVTASHDKTTRLWDASTGLPVSDPMRHEDIVMSAEFSPDGKRVVTASGNNTARVWDASTGKPVSGPMRHEDKVRSAHFSPDGKRVVTASDDKTARLWDASTGLPVSEPMRHKSVVESAEFSPDGKQVITASWNNTARVWDVSTGKLISGTIRTRFRMFSAKFSADGKWVVTASGEKIARVWDASTGLPVSEPMRHESAVESAEFSPDGKQVITASWDNTARVWDASTGKPVSEPMRHEDKVRSAHFSPDGKWVVTASAETVRMWDAETGKPISEPMRHRGNVKSAEFSPDGKWVSIASDNKARLLAVLPTNIGSSMDGLAELGEQVSMARLGEQGGMERMDTSPIQNIQRMLDAGQLIGDAKIIAEWLLARHADRTLVPFHALTLHDWIHNRLNEPSCPTNELQMAVTLATEEKSIPVSPSDREKIEALLNPEP